MAVPPFEWEDATLADLAAAMAAGKTSSRALTEAYLARIEAVDRVGPSLRSIIELNPDALEIAAGLDAERREKGPRGPLHGIPVLIKDNIDTADRMRTSAGSIALGGPPAPREAFIAARLREAGAVLLGKTNLSEWANFRSTRSTSGWSSRGGQTRNPHVLDRNPCGSSSGTGAAIAASLAAVGVGTETDGSVVCPSHVNGIVGIKPTVGLCSRTGIIPISASQDTAGPMARTVADAALLLGVLAGVDPREKAAAPRAIPDFAASLDPAGLRGARLGVVRNSGIGSPWVTTVYEASLRALRDAGATLVDPADIPHLGEYDDDELEVLLFEFKDGLNAYLSTRPEGSIPARSLAALIRFNEAQRAAAMPYFGQEIFEMAQERGPLASPAYRKARAKCVRLSRREGIDAVLAKHRLDALVVPTGGPAWLTDLVNADHYGGGSSTAAAVAGYPSITVPAGHAFGLPLGISFIGTAWSEASLIRFAFAFESATRARRTPRFLRTVELAPA